MGEIQSSDRLREFYKQLIRTDAQIQNLKKSNEIGLTSTDNIEDSYNTYPDRAKRSLKTFHKPMKLFHFRKNKKDKVKQNNKNINENNKLNDKNNKNIDTTEVPIKANKAAKLKSEHASRNKRFDNTSEPEGILIENKKVLIQYKPKHINRKSKCSHAPKDSKSHENQLKHPFYQNTQRLDELLDKFLDKNLPEIMADNFGFDMLLEKEKKCKHPKIETDAAKVESTKEKFFINTDKPDIKINNEFKKTNLNKDEFKNDYNKDELKYSNGFENNDFTKILKTEMSTAQNDNIFNDLEFGDDDRKREDTITNDYGLLMSVSTMMYASNNNIKRTTYPQTMDRMPNARKLLQTDTDDDMNEVIFGTHDEAVMDDRKKKVQEPTLEDLNNKLKMNPANIVNPNWKGPMPLYPDELHSLIKQEPIIVNTVETSVRGKYNTEADESIANKDDSNDRRMKDASETDESLIDRDETPVNSRDSPSEKDEFENEINDIEYIEDYFRNKYDRLVELAQAYSDYGVLEGKKTTDKVDNKVKQEVTDHKLSLKGFKEGFKNSIFKRPKKRGQEPNIPSEGIRLEFQPTTASREDNPLDIYRVIQKHIKVSNMKSKQNLPKDLSIGQEKDLMLTSSNENIKTTKRFDLANDDGLIFSVGKGKRTLKSLEFDNKDTFSENEDSDLDVSDRTNIKHKREIGNNLLSENTSNNVTSKVMKLNTINDLDKNSTKYAADDDAAINMKLDKGQELNNNTDMSLSDFFMLLSDWFSALGEGGVNSNHRSIRNLSVTHPNQTKTNELNNNNTEMLFPVYDSDMIDNIGHRSRVLLSVEDVNDTVKVEHDNDKEMTKVNYSTDDVITANFSNDTSKTNIINENKTKSIVKRDVHDSNLLFWNDLYDDEYGVIDHFENNVRNKHSVGKSDLKKPNDWFRDNVKKIANGFRERAKSFKKEHKNVNAVKQKENTVKEETNIKSKPEESVYKRISRNVDDNGEARKTDFAALTANMKKICRKAARDVSQAKNIDVREVSKEGRVASTLMQQLVRLMGDLVDYQVKQRTCRTLPPDLQNFLEWLTSTSPESASKTEDYPEVDFDHTLGTATSSERDGGPDSRTDCLGTLQSVQALIRQYEELNDDDKSKMTGVKEYLDSQLQYLQKQMTAINNNSLYNIDSLRYRRDVSSKMTSKNKCTSKKRKHRFKETISNLMKKFGKNHHKTNSNNKTFNSAINKAKVNNTKINNEKSDDINNNVGTETVKEKRNLRDVYYKAIADAKKLTTVKNHRK